MKEIYILAIVASVVIIIFSIFNRGVSIYVANNREIFTIVNGIKNVIEDKQDVRLDIKIKKRIIKIRIINKDGIAYVYANKNLIRKVYPESYAEITRDTLGTY